MDFKQISSFLNVARCKSFTDAAAMAFISQSAISRQISCMENEIGVALLCRGKRSVSLTCAGEIMFEAFNDILSRYDDALKAVQQTSLDCLPFKLGIANFIPFDILPPQIKSYVSEKRIAAEYVDFPDLCTQLQNHKYNAIITLKKKVERTPNILYYPFSTVQMCLVYSKSFLEGKEAQGFSALDGYDFYIPEETYIQGGYDDVILICNELNIRPGSVNMVNNTNTMFMVAETGQGVIILDDYARRNLLSPEITFSPTPFTHEFVIAFNENENHELWPEIESYFKESQ